MKLLIFMLLLIEIRNIKIMKKIKNQNYKTPKSISKLYKFAAILMHFTPSSMG